MEEIVSADAIQGEIAEDARKKADRILAEADEESGRILAESEAKAVSVVGEIHRTSEASAARFRMETMARVPLERTRMRTVFVDGRLREAMAEYLGSLSEERVASLSKAMLDRGASFLEGKSLELRRRGLSEAAARDAASALSGVASIDRIVEDRALPERGLKASALDGSAELGATMDLVGERLLDLRRGELAAALCAGALKPVRGEAGS
jgi:hypothetical protein